MEGEWKALTNIRRGEMKWIPLKTPFLLLLLLNVLMRCSKCEILKVARVPPGYMSYKTTSSSLPRPAKDIVNSNKATACNKCQLEFRGETTKQFGVKSSGLTKNWDFQLMQHSIRRRPPPLSLLAPQYVMYIKTYCPEQTGESRVTKREI